MRQRCHVGVIPLCMPRHSICTRFHSELEHEVIREKLNLGIVVYGDDFIRKVHLLSAFRFP